MELNVGWGLDAMAEQRTKMEEYCLPKPEATWKETGNRILNWRLLESRPSSYCVLFGSQTLDSAFLYTGFEFNIPGCAGRGFFLVSLFLWVQSDAEGQVLIQAILGEASQKKKPISHPRNRR